MGNRISKKDTHDIIVFLRKSMKTQLKTYGMQQKQKFIAIQSYLKK